MYAYMLIIYVGGPSRDGNLLLIKLHVNGLT